MSSSPRVTRLSSPVFEVGISPSPLGTADAALVSDNDNPAAPNIGRALLRRFRFEVSFACIANSFHTSADVLDRWAAFRSDAKTIYTEQETPHRRTLSEPVPSNFRNFLTKPVISGKTGHFWQNRSFLAKPVHQFTQRSGLTCLPGSGEVFSPSPRSSQVPGSGSQGALGSRPGNIRVDTLPPVIASF
jgi:hypothetical protein